MTKFFFRNSVIFILILSLNILLILNFDLSDAREEYADYVPGPFKGKCEACHSGSGLDLYGRDFELIPNHASDPGGAIRSIAGDDSDDDGFTNSDELKQGTFPGDPESFPETSIYQRIPLRQISFIFISFITIVMIIILYNRGYRPLDNSKNNDKNIKNENENPVPKKNIEIALQRLNQDYISGNLDKDAYLNLKNKYKRILETRNFDNDIN